MADEISGTVQSPAQTTEAEPKKRKVSIFNIILLIAFLVVIGVAVYYYSGDEYQLGDCSLDEECGKYDIFYVTGQGYVCANDEVVGENAIKNKLLMFKYASRRATVDEPIECACIESQCEQLFE